MGSLGYKHSELTKLKMSESRKGRVGCMSGKHHTLQTRLKMSMSHKGKPSGMLGHKHSEETKRKFSELSSGINNSMYGVSLLSKFKGKKHSPESIVRIKEGHKKSPQFGNKNPKWRGGISKENHLQRTSLKYKEWRKSVFIRDNFTCIICGEVGKYLNAHHIKTFKDYPELRYEVSNGITMCRDCHYIEHRGNKCS
jgi:hypothetical protein